MWLWPGKLNGARLNHRVLNDVLVGLPFWYSHIGDDTADHHLIDALWTSTPPNIRFVDVDTSQHMKMALAQIRTGR